MGGNLCFSMTELQRRFFFPHFDHKENTMDQKDKTRYIQTCTQNMVDRIFEIEKEKCTTVPTKLTDEEKLKKIRYDDVLLKPNAKLDTPLEKAFDFSKCRPRPVIDREAFALSLSPFLAMFQEIHDALVLQSYERAQELFFEFRSYVDDYLTINKKLPIAYRPLSDDGEEGEDED